MPALEDFLLKYSRFAQTQVDHSIIEGYLNTAAMLCGDVWGKKRVMGIQLLTAHFLEMEFQQTAVTAGMATAIAQGSTPIMRGNENDLQLTTYGRQYLILKRSIAATGFSI